VGVLQFPLNQDKLASDPEGTIMGHWTRPLRRCAFVLQHRPNVHRVEIELTTRCNLMCRHCDRRCSQAPANVDLPVTVVEQFVEESRTLRHRWEKIGLLGGEPTLHPNLRTIIAILSNYVRTFDGCEFFLVSNAHGPKVNRILDSIRPAIAVVERPKTCDEPSFNNMDIAPVDLSDEVRSCHVTSDCGLGLTSWGYFPCGAGAGIARALELDVGIKSLQDVTEEAMIEVLRQLCQYCGHALAVPVGADGSVSPFWKAANQQYHDWIATNHQGRGL